MALATHAVIPVGTMYAERLAYPLLAGGCIGAAVLMTQLRRFGGGWLRWSVICVCLLFLLGLTRDRTRSWQDDGTLFASALRVRGGSARVHYGWGLWQQQQGQHAAALDSYQQALRIHPRYPDALYNQGAALLRLGRTVEALASYEAATRARPGHVQGLFAVAAIKEALGAVDASVAYLEVLQHRPGHVEAARGAARCLAAQGDSAAAEVILQRVFAGSAQSEWRRLTQP